MSSPVAFRPVERIRMHDACVPKLLEFARLAHVERIVTLDSLLSPCVLALPADELWHDTQIEWPLDTYPRWGFFSSLDLVRSRIAGRNDVEILRVVVNPADANASVVDDARFVFHGYDLCDESLGSALWNCGGYDEALPHQGPNGLIRDLELARRVSARLSELHPDERHAQTDVWAIWTFEPLGARGDGSTR